LLASSKQITGHIRPSQSPGCSVQVVRFEHVIDVACRVDDANDFDAVVGGTVENQVLLESLDPPDTRPARRGLADGHRSPMPDMLAILPKVMLAAS
jgi:hypothetical protein